MRQRQETQLLRILIGGVAGLIGLVLLIMWWWEFVLVFRGILPFGLLVFSLLTILRTMGVSLQGVRRALVRSGREILGLESPEIALQLRCPNCGAMASQGTKFCLQCGSLLPQPKICPRCQKVNVAEAEFCGYCGQSLS